MIARSWFQGFGSGSGTLGLGIEVSGVHGRPSNATSGPSHSIPHHWQSRTDVTLHTRTHRYSYTQQEDFLTTYLLKLFVTGASSRSGAAIANLNRICEQELAGRYKLEIIDVLEHPDLAEDEKILATPTLIKSLPLPLRRVIGDLSNTEKVLLGLEVHLREDDATSAQGELR
jgi:circadian clock protein KaiB